MSKPKPVPSPPATLPSGMLDCDPDPTPAFLAELQNEHVQRTLDWVNTPPDVLRQRRQRREELEHEQAKAAIWKETQLPRISLPVAGVPDRKCSVSSRPDPQAQARYKRIREIPRAVRLPQYVQKLDEMQRPFNTPQDWQAAGCPRSYGEAFKHPRWRRKIGHERQNAWRSKNLSK